ncbi:MAG TPA: Hpt domain-containing protein [Thermoanaerobaculia bacterium]
MDHELDELRREFLVEAEEKVREMESFAEGDRPREILDRLAYLAHQLKGSGGSYGYQDISTDAAELEKAVETLVEGSADGLDAKIRQHIGNLRTEIERGLAELQA